MRSLGLCLVCGNSGHFKFQCTDMKYRCKKCKDPHHYSVCISGHVGNSSSETGVKRGDRREKTLKSVKDERKKGSEEKDVHTKVLKISEEKVARVSVLPTATINLEGRCGKTVHVRGLLDPCAERTFVTEKTLTKVKYHERGTVSIRIHGYCSSLEEKEYRVVRLTIPRNQGNLYLDAVVVDKLPSYNKEFDMRSVRFKLKEKKINLADKEFFLPKDRQSPIGILVGVDMVYKLLHPGFKRLNNLVLLSSIFGYVLTGSLQTAQAESETRVVSILKVATDERDSLVIPERTDIVTEKTLESLWAMDHVGITDDGSNEVDKLVMRDFENNITFNEEDRQYVVKLPWKEWPPVLSSNFGLAIGRLNNLLRKFQNDSVYFQHYQDILNEQEKRGFIERVKEGKTNGVHYLAHHGVKRESKTTPVRIVFDCSARSCSNSNSLNDCLWTGPPLTSDLTQVLLRFRLNKYVCLSDIEKAFLMVQLREEDRDYTRFLWYKDPLSPNKELITYRFKVVLFGATCSPFLLNATILKHLSSLEEDTTHIREGLYVDNLLYTCNDEQELSSFFLHVSDIFAEAHLYLKEWISNSNVLQTMVRNLKVSGSDNNVTKILGLK